MSILAALTAYSFFLLICTSETWGLAPRAWRCAEATSVSLQWRQHQPAAGGRASRGPGSARPWGTSCRKDTGGHLPSRNVPKFLSAPGDLQGSGSGPAPVLPMALSWAKAMSTPGLFMRTEMMCWGNGNGLLCTFVKNFNVPSFSGKCKQLAPEFQELGFVVPRISSIRCLVMKMP